MISRKNTTKYIGKGKKGIRGARSPGTSNKLFKWDSWSKNGFRGFNGSEPNISLIRRPGYFVALVLLMVAVLASVVLARMNWNETIYSKSTSYNLPPRKSSAIIFDETDGMAKEQYDTCMKEIEAIRAGQRTGDRLALYVIRRDEPDHNGKLSLLFSKERPRDGSNANFLHENPQMISDFFFEEYEKPLGQAIKSLNPNQKANSSPILKAIRTASRCNADGEGQLNELILFSNMLENGTQISFYGKMLVSFRSLEHRSLLLLDVKDKLAGVTVTVYRIANSNYGQKHEKFWREYFEFAGATYRSYLM